MSNEIFPNKSDMIAKLEELVLNVDNLVNTIRTSNVPKEMLDKIPLLDFYKDDLVIAIKKLKEAQ
jgi:hypothetical protein